jgi:hypothetical protein
MKPEDPDPGTVVAGYPRVDYPPYYLTQAPDDSYAYELDTPGLILSVEPETHDAGDPEVHHSAPIPGGEWTGRPANMDAHMLDRGAVLMQTYSDPSMRAADERPVTERWESAPLQAPSTVAALRGTNSLEPNNPEGYRYGWLVKRYYHREMPHEWFKHTERALHPGGAAKAVDSPSMGAAGNRYVSPFAWRSFYGARNLQRPIMRRNPPEAWDDQTNDGMAEQSDVPADWVVG